MVSAETEAALTEIQDLILRKRTEVSEEGGSALKQGHFEAYAGA